VLAGVSRGLLEVCAITLLQRVTPTALLARTLAVKEGLTMAAWGLGSVLVPAPTAPCPRGRASSRRGELAAGHFAIADGLVDVTRDDRRLATRGRGDGFGEIALLRDVRRTASVTARTDALLLAVERDAFITSVTGHAESARRAGSIIEERLPAVQ
jgi:CRP-like cAMP-binding protein